jgi:hypothetical protein
MSAASFALAVKQARQDTSAEFAPEDRALLDQAALTRTHQLPVRLSLFEVGTIKAAAKEAGLTVSTYVRSKIL